VLNKYILGFRLETKTLKEKIEAKFGTLWALKNCWRIGDVPVSEPGCLKVTGFENADLISHLLTSVNIKRRLGEISEWIFVQHLGHNHWYTIDGETSGRLGIKVWTAKRVHG